MQGRVWAVLGLVSLALTGCSGSDVIVRKQVEMEGSLERLAASNTALNTRVEKLTDSMKDLQTQVKGAAGDPEIFSHFRIQVEEMHKKLGELKQALLQVQQNQSQQATALQQLSAAQKEAASAQQAAQAAQPAPAVAAPAEASPAPAPAKPEAAAPAQDTAQKAAAATPQETQAPVKAAKDRRRLPAKEAYDRAFALFRSGKYSAAAEAFENFAKEEPTNALAPNAYYWTGECYYTQKHYARALDAFNKVVADYPRDRKVPDALLKIGFTQISLKDTAKAKGTLKGLVDKYPHSPAAAKAREKLARL